MDSTLSGRTSCSGEENEYEEPICQYLDTNGLALVVTNYGKMALLNVRQAPSCQCALLLGCRSWGPSVCQHHSCQHSPLKAPSIPDLRQDTNIVQTVETGDHYRRMDDVVSHEEEIYLWACVLIWISLIGAFNFKVYIFLICFHFVLVLARHHGISLKY